MSRSGSARLFPLNFDFFRELAPAVLEQTAVDVILPPTPSSTSGCEAADFAGFPAGNVALIQRGTCTFRQKADNAAAAGASAVVIFNEGQPGRTDLVIGTLGSAGVPSRWWPAQQRNRARSGAAPDDGQRERLARDGNETVVSFPVPR